MLYNSDFFRFDIDDFSWMKGCLMDLMKLINYGLK